MMFPAKMPRLIKKAFPNYVWDFFSEGTSKTDKVLYLTFDDGPQPEITEFVLNELAKYNAKATFFCIGANIEKDPETFNKIIQQGHSIGNHTQHHLEGWKVSKEDYVTDTLKAQDAINSQISNFKFQNRTPETVTLFRPPYGRIKKSQGKALRALGYKIVMWDVVAKDWLQTISEEECLNNIIKNTSNRSIIVMHDSVKASKNVKYILPKALEHFSKQGFEFKAIEF